MPRTIRGMRSPFPAIEDSDMLMRILATGLVAGVLAGVVVAGLQTVTTTPLILKAEAYEKVEGGHEHTHGPVTPAQSDDAAPGANELADEWSPRDGLERTAFTTLATVASGIGFAFMLLAALIASGVAPTVRAGLAWAAGAFVATGLAPALGLPPELPGSAAAELVQRQIWWVATVAATGVGLWLIAHIASIWTIVLGIALIVAPHIVGAPHPHEYSSEVPAEIAGHFTASSLVVPAVLWALVGTIAGYIWQRADSRAGVA
jgi:cobalt transporter subunit CbtA